MRKCGTAYRSNNRKAFERLEAVPWQHIIHLPIVGPTDIIAFDGEPVFLVLDVALSKVSRRR